MSKTFGLTKAMAVVPLLLLALCGCSRLAAFNAVIPKDPGAVLAATGISYGSDARQKLDVYAPANSAKPAGIVVFAYGGSWNSGDRRDYSFVGRAFAGRGYVVVIFDYRLVPQIRYPAFVEDTAKAVAWSYRNAKRYGADPRHLYLLGHSAGAYNATMVTLAPEFLAKEKLSPSIIRATGGLSGPYYFLPLAVDETREAFKGVADLEKTQPANHIRRDRPVPPILLLHGEADDFVYPKNSTVLAAALRKAGHSAQHKIYPGVDHVGTLLAISRPLRGRAPVVDDVVGFFAAH